MNSPMMNSPVPFTPENRDARLLSALHLLETPVRQAPSPYIPLLASSGLAGAALLLAYTMVIGPALKDAPPADRTIAENNSGFEISSHPGTSADKTIKAQSVTPPVKEAVMVGTEASR